MFNQHTTSNSEPKQYTKCANIQITSQLEYMWKQMVERKGLSGTFFHH